MFLKPCATRSEAGARHYCIYILRTRCPDTQAQSLGQCSQSVSQSQLTLVQVFIVRRPAHSHSVEYTILLVLSCVYSSTVECRLTEESDIHSVTSQATEEKVEVQKIQEKVLGLWIYFV